MPISAILEHMLRERTLALTQKKPLETGKCVLYIMSRDQRAHDNHALLAAQACATEQQLPLVVGFVLTKSMGLRRREHVQFMLSGLREVAEALQHHNIPMIFRIGEPSAELSRLSRDLQPAAIYFDFNPLKPIRDRVKAFAASEEAPCFVVDTHNIIPCWHASPAEDFAAHTFRSKVHKQLATYLVEPNTLQKHPYSLKQLPQSATATALRKHATTVPTAGIDLSQIPSGEAAAKNHLKEFITNHLAEYAHRRNDMSQDHQSGLSPYLHFGQISALRVALELRYHVDETPYLMQVAKLASPGETPSEIDGLNAIYEEMIVRKELSDNYCFYNPNYRSLEGCKPWAITTLTEHRTDTREVVYDRDQLEAAQTHDEAWNAAQLQLTKTGKIHGYMRMYWAKKILEWSTDPETAIADAIYLNDSYSIDGGDPNGYVGILWSIGGLHDRPWTERPIFGKIRYMNYDGLKRKFDIATYIQTWTTHAS